jgi:predicted nucleotidyltransferase
MRKFSLLDSLLPKIRQAVLAATVLHPDRWWYLSDLAQHLRVTPSSLQRELASLVAAGILQSRRDGNRVYYQPDPACPILPELRGLLIKTIGIADVLRDMLTPFGSKIDVAFLYGSVARGEETSASDVDLMIVGGLRLAEAASALREAEKRLQRPVNPTLFSPQEFVQKATEGNHFVTTVLRGEKIYLIGSEHDMANVATETEVEEIITEAEHFCQMAEAWIVTNYPHLIPVTP